MGAGGLGGEIDDLGRPVVDHRAHDDGDIVERVESGPHREAVVGGDRVDDVAVGGKVARVDADDGSFRSQPQRGAHDLVQVHGRAVVDDDLSGLGADQRSETVADSLGQVDPVLPTADQVGRPVVAHHGVDPVEGSPRRHPERVAVEIGEFGVRDVKLVAPSRQRVVAVEVVRPLS